MDKIIIRGIEQTFLMVESGMTQQNKVFQHLVDLI